MGKRCRFVLDEAGGGVILLRKRPSALSLLRMV